MQVLNLVSPLFQFGPKFILNYVIRKYKISSKRVYDNNDNLTNFSPQPFTNNRFDDDNITIQKIKHTSDPTESRPKIFALEEMGPKKIGGNVMGYQIIGY